MTHDEMVRYIAACIRSESGWRGKSVRELLTDGFFQYRIVMGKWSYTAIEKAVKIVASE